MSGSPIDGIPQAMRVPRNPTDEAFERAKAAVSAVLAGEIKPADPVLTTPTTPAPALPRFENMLANPLMTTPGSTAESEADIAQGAALLADRHKLAVLLETLASVSSKVPGLQPLSATALTIARGAWILEEAEHIMHRMAPGVDFKDMTLTQKTVLALELGLKLNLHEKLHHHIEHVFGELIAPLLSHEAYEVGSKAWDKLIQRVMTNIEKGLPPEAFIELEKGDKVIEGLGNLKQSLFEALEKAKTQLNRVADELKTQMGKIRPPATSARMDTSSLLSQTSNIVERATQAYEKQLLTEMYKPTHLSVMDALVEALERSGGSMHINTSATGLNIGLHFGTGPRHLMGLDPARFNTADHIARYNYVYFLEQIQRGLHGLSAEDKQKHAKDKLKRLTRKALTKSDMLAQIQALIEAAQAKQSTIQSKYDQAAEKLKTGDGDVTRIVNLKKELDRFTVEIGVYREAEQVYQKIQAHWPTIKNTQMSTVIQAHINARVNTPTENQDEARRHIVAANEDVAHASNQWVRAPRMTRIERATTHFTHALLHLAHLPEALRTGLLGTSRTLLERIMKHCADEAAAGPINAEKIRQVIKTLNEQIGVLPCSKAEQDKINKAFVKHIPALITALPEKKAESGHGLAADDLPRMPIGLPGAGPTVEESLPATARPEGAKDTLPGATSPPVEQIDPPLGGRPTSAELPTASKPTKQRWRAQSNRSVLSAKEKEWIASLGQMSDRELNSGWTPHHPCNPIASRVPDWLAVVIPDRPADNGTIDPPIVQTSSASTGFWGGLAAAAAGVGAFFVGKRRENSAIPAYKPPAQARYSTGVYSASSGMGGYYGGSRGSSSSYSGGSSDWGSSVQSSVGSYLDSCRP